LIPSEGTGGVAGTVAIGLGTVADQIPIKDLVPEESRIGDYTVIRDKMERNLALPDKVHRYATHEAGHLIYLIRTKLLVSPPDAIYEGPTIYCEYGEIKGYIAAVTSKTISATHRSFDYGNDGLFEKLALVAAAAGVFEETLLGADEDTETAIQGDKAELYKHCKKARLEDGIEFEGLLLWGFAQRETTKWIQAERTDVDCLMEIARQVILKNCFKSKVDLSGVNFAASLRHPEVSSLLLRLLFE
jgi:hypothetical protein